MGIASGKMRFKCNAWIKSRTRSVETNTTKDNCTCKELGKSSLESSHGMKITRSVNIVFLNPLKSGSIRASWRFNLRIRIRKKLSSWDSSCRIILQLSSYHKMDAEYRNSARYTDLDKERNKRTKKNVEINFVRISDMKKLPMKFWLHRWRLHICIVSVCSMQ